MSPATPSVHNSYTGKQAVQPTTMLTRPLEIISQTRLRVIHRLLMPLLTWIDRLIASMSDVDDAMIGTTMRAPKRCQLWPLPQRDA